MNLTSVLEFLRSLAANNNKAWMDAHRADYHRARAEYTAFVAELLRLASAELEPGLRGLSPQDVREFVWGLGKLGFCWQFNTVRRPRARSGADS